MNSTLGPSPRTSTARFTPFTVRRWASAPAFRGLMKSLNSRGTATGRPSRLTQTNTNSAVAIRVSSRTRRAVWRMVKLVRP